MSVRNVQVVIIIIISIILVSPQVLNTAGFMTLELADRNSTVSVSENDSNGIMEMNEAQNATIGEDSEKLVTVTNNLNRKQKTSVDLEPDISWTISDSEGSTRRLGKQDSTTYSVDTTLVDSSVSEGNYTVKMINGSFLVTAQRTIPIVEPDILTSDRSVIYKGFTGISEDESQEESIENSDSVSALGPSSRDFTGDGRNDIPYIDSSGKIKITDADGNTKTLVGSSPSPNTDKTLMGVGTWKGSPPSVFYAGDESSVIYRVDADGNTEKIAEPDNGVQAVSGFGDIDDNGQKELVFSDSSQQLRYLEQDGTTNKIDGGGLGSSSGLGAGQLPDLDGDGIPRIVGVDGSNNIFIIGVAEPTVKIKKVSAAKSPITPSDIDADGDNEILYVGKDNSYIKYVDNPLSNPDIRSLTDNNGNLVSGGKELGVISG